MLYSHMDLLSYEEIDRDVDRIYRAFCDTTLIQYAHGNPGSAGKYWKQVLEFRRKHLSPFDREDVLSLAVNAHLEEQSLEVQQKKWENHREEYMHVVGFLYWFDVRSDYWSREGVDERLIKTLVPTNQLGALYLQAVAAQKRIHEAKEVAPLLEWSAWDRHDRNVVVIQRMLQNPPGDAKRRSPPPDQGSK